MKDFVKHLILLSLLFLSLEAQAEDDAIEDDGTNSEGRVIIAETLVDRCNLAGTSNPEIPEDCINKLMSDARLGKTPEGDDYDYISKKILKEQTTGYMETAIKRLIEASQHEDKSDDLAGKGSSGASGDSRDDVEQIIKLSTDTGEIAADILDSISLRNTLLSTENLLFSVITSSASSMSIEEAEDASLRETKIGGF